MEKAVPFQFDFSGVSDMEKAPHISATHRRSRTLSTFSVASNKSLKLKLDIPKSPPARSVAVSSGPYSANGSFSPTISACASLRFIAKCSSSRDRTVSLHARPKHRLTISTVDSSPSPPWEKTSTPSSPLSIKSFSSSIPSISRTSSSFSAADTLSTAPTSAYQSRDPSPDRRVKPSKLHPILAACEKGSKFTTRTVCATCSKRGRDYPKCGKCGEMWCSRACRLRDGAKRHVC